MTVPPRPLLAFQAAPSDRIYFSDLILEYLITLISLSHTMSSTHEEPTRLVVLLSGYGSNLQAIIDACSTEKLPSTKIVRVICEHCHLPIPSVANSLMPLKVIARMLSVSNGPRKRRSLGRIIILFLSVGNTLVTRRLLSMLLTMSMFFPDGNPEVRWSF